MKIIYHCYGGAHSSVTAANMHLGLLPVDRTPRLRELVNQKLFDHNKVEDSGKICFMGSDDLGNEVYVVGRRSRPMLIYNITRLLEKFFNIAPGSYLLVDVAPYVNIAMKVGGILSRRLGLVSIGRPLVTLGTLRAYKNIAKLVESTKSQIMEITPTGQSTKGNSLTGG